MNLLSQFILYLQSLDKKPSKITIKNYKADVGQFIKWFETSFHKVFNPLEVSPQIIDIYKKEKVKSISPKSLKRHISSLNRFFQFLRQEGIITKSPLEQTTIIPKSQDLWHIKDFKNYLYIYNASNLTIKNYTNDVLQFLNWAKRVTGVVHSWNVKEQDIFTKIDSSLFAHYKDRLLNEAKLSPKSVNRKLSSLRKYLSWIETQGIIKPISHLETNVMVNKVDFESDQQNLQPAKPYSKFPPLRLFQKILKGSNYALEYLFIIPFAAIINQAESLIPTRKKLSFVKPESITKQAYIPNIPKSFYAPISTTYLPWHKKLFVFLKYKRANWYRKYHSYPVVSYFHFSILIILLTLTTAFLYKYLDNSTSQKATLSSFIGPKTLHFNGKLLDRLGAPITSQKNITFSLYNHPTQSGSSLLWQEILPITPQNDGTFTITLGQKNPILQSIFDSPQIFLGIQVGSDEELKPRQELPTSRFSQISSSVQGLEPILSTDDTKNVLLALDSSGNLNIGQNASPTFQATGGSFTLSGKTLVLNSIPGTSGNIILSPDGFGKIDTQKPIINTASEGTISPGAVEIDDKLVVNATESAVAAFVLNNNSTGDLFTASSSGSTKFVIDSDGWVGIGVAVPENALDVKGNITPVDSGQYNIGSPLRSWKNIYTQNVFPTLISGTQGWWQRNSAVISPLNTTDDFILGATASDAAKLRIEGISGNILSKGNFTFDDTNGLIQTTNNRTLTLGGSNTGNIILNPKNSNLGGYVGPLTDNVTDLGASSSARFRSLYVGPSSLHVQCTTTEGCSQTLDYAISISTTSGNLQFGLNSTTANPNNYFFITQGGSFGFGTSTPSAFLDIAGNVNLFSTKTYKINSTDVLSSTTLGTGVVSSSLTQVGTISSGTWQATSIKANYGGTGVTTYSTGNLLYAASTNPTSLSKLNIGTSNQVLTVSGGLPTWQTPPFIRNLGSIMQSYITDDLVIGGNSTSSAKFAVLNLSGVDTPTASISAQNALAQALVLSGDGSIQTVRNNTLTLGGNTTGDIILNPSNATAGGVVRPNLTNVTDLGTSTFQFRNIYAQNHYGTFISGSNILKSFFDQTNGAVYPSNSSVDLLVGGTSSSSASFHVYGASQRGTQPVASISANTSFAALVVDNRGKGDIFTASSSGLTRFVVSQGGNVGIGTPSPSFKLHISDSQATNAAAFIENTDTGPTSTALALKLGYSGIGTTTNYFVKFLNGDGILEGKIRSFTGGGGGVRYDTTGNDLAEYFKISASVPRIVPQSSALEPEDLICLASDGGAIKCDLANNNILGIISDRAGFVGGSNHDQDPNYVLVGLLGQLPLKVSTQSGSIKPGDYLTNSSTPGVAMKATKAGRIVGRALESYEDINVGKILVVVQPTFHDPDIYITETGNLSIDLEPKFGLVPTNITNQSQPISFKLNNKATGELINRIGAFKSAVIANLEAGFIKAKEISVAGTVEAQAIITQTVETAKVNANELTATTLSAANATIDSISAKDIVSPIANIDQIHTNTITPLSSDSVVLKGKLEIQNASGSAVASIDSSGNASFSGQLTAQSGQFNNLTIEQFNNGNANISSLSAQLTHVDNLSAVFATFQQGLISLSPSTFTDASFTGTVTIGTPNGGLILADNSINVLGNLEIQPLRQGNVNFFGGLVSIDIEGNLNVKGKASFEKDLIVKGKLDVSGDIAASGTATFGKLNLNPVNKALALSSSEIIATGSAGIATISAFQSELTIRNNLVTDKSLIYITPSGNTKNEVLYLFRQKQGESFTVGVNNQLQTEIPFNWLIVN